MGIGVTIDGDTLLCPVCKENNLHQEAVEVVFRHEDKDGSRHRIERDRSALEVAKDADVGNITRRDYLCIRFSCEHCQGFQRLLIRQHKGCTFIEWMAA